MQVRKSTLSRRLLVSAFRRFDDLREAAKGICDELRKNRYVLSYVPQSVTLSEPRRLLVMGERGIDARSKTMQPVN